MVGFYNIDDGPRPGPVMEVALKVPSESEKNLVRVENNYNNLEGLFGNARFLRIMTLIRAVFYMMTWPPYDSYMQGRPDSNRMSCFSFQTPTGLFQVSLAKCLLDLRRIEQSNLAHIVTSPPRPPIQRRCSRNCSTLATSLAMKTCTMATNSSIKPRRYGPR